MRFTCLNAVLIALESRQAGPHILAQPPSGYAATVMISDADQLTSGSVCGQYSQAYWDCAVRSLEAIDALALSHGRQITLPVVCAGLTIEPSVTADVPENTPPHRHHLW